MQPDKWKGLQHRSQFGERRNETRGGNPHTTHRKCAPMGAPFCRVVPAVVDGLEGSQVLPDAAVGFILEGGGVRQPPQRMPRASPYGLELFPPRQGLARELTE